jgi:hypothetical protein
VVVPVNIRGQVQTTDCGNRITFLPVSFPLSIENPRELIDAVRMAVARVRSAHLPELVGLLGTWIGAIPSPVQAIVGPLISQLPLSLCNLICTNVPGPPVPLYFSGHRMLSCYPYVPIGGEMGMNCAVLTYNGTAYFGFTGDAQAIPDLELLVGLLKTSFDELSKASGVPPAPRKRSRVNKTKTRKTKTHKTKTHKTKTHKTKTNLAPVSAPAPPPVESSAVSAPTIPAPQPVEAVQPSAPREMAAAAAGAT